MSMPSGLPPMWVVNMDRDTARLARFHARNAHLCDVGRVAALDGSALDRAQLEAAGFIAADLRYSSGTLGCAMSHIGVWRMAAAGETGMTVFEDDAVTVHGFERRASAVLAALPDDWDIVHWGLLLNPLSIWADLGSSLVRIDAVGPRRFDGPAGIAAFQAQDLRPAALKLRHGFGTAGYSVSARGAQAILAAVLPLTNDSVNIADTGFNYWNEGIDTALCRIYSQVRAYACLPVLCLPFDDGISTRVLADQERGVT